MGRRLSFYGLVHWAAMKMSLPLYVKLTLVLVALFLISGLAFSWIGLQYSQAYHYEVTQKLHQSLSKYIVEHQKESFFNDDATINEKVLSQIAMHTMMINPMVEVYLLNNQGQVLGHALHTDDVKLQAVSTAPIHKFLKKEFKSGAILGDNPRNPQAQNVFSVAPVFDKNSQQLGYLYTILSSHEVTSLQDQLSSSYVLKVALLLIILIIMLSLLIAMISFRSITRPIRLLASETRGYRQTLNDSTKIKSPQLFSDGMGFLENQSNEEKVPGNTLSQTQNPEINDEIKDLSLSFSQMKQRIISQFDEINRNDQLRRDLITNISHDLRTPIASIQGYIEALMIRYDSLPQDTHQQYLKTAFRNSQKLNHLISQLFELSKLDGNGVQPEFEVFSLSELIHDIVQDYQLQAKKKGINLKAIANTNAHVKADIRLIGQVFQNLIDNALRHTPNGGNVCIKLHNRNNLILIEVTDTGKGIKKESLPFVFDRYFTESPAPKKNIPMSTGLGLAIVKRILTLHESMIEVSSIQNKGSSFRFHLKPA